MDITIAHNLKKLREAARYTQEEVARVLGITRSAYSNYESGEREIPYNVIEDASDFYGCDMTMLFEESENVDSMIPVATIDLSIIDLNPPYQDLILKMLLDLGLIFFTEEE